MSNVAPSCLARTFCTMPAIRSDPRPGTSVSTITASSSWRYASGWTPTQNVERGRVLGPEDHPDRLGDLLGDRSSCRHLPRQVFHQRAPDDPGVPEPVPEPRLEPADRREVLRRPRVGRPAGVPRAGAPTPGRRPRSPRCQVESRRGPRTGRRPRGRATAPARARAACTRRSARTGSLGSPEPEQRRPLARPEPADQRFLVGPEVLVLKRLTTPTTGHFVASSRVSGPSTSTSRPDLRCERRRHPGLGLPHLVLQPEQRQRRARSPSRTPAGTGRSLAPIRTSNRSGLDPAAGDQHAPDAVLAEGRRSVGADRAHRERPEQAGHAPAVGVRLEADLNPPDAVHEPDRDGFGDLDCLDRGRPVRRSRRAGWPWRRAGRRGPPGIPFRTRASRGRRAG